jgi:hypothetical protein
VYFSPLVKYCAPAESLRLTCACARSARALHGHFALRVGDVLHFVHRAGPHFEVALSRAGSPHQLAKTGRLPATGVQPPRCKEGLSAWTPKRPAGSPPPPKRPSGPPPLRPGRRDISAALLETWGAAVSCADVLRALESVEIPINKSRKNVKQSEDQVEHPPITPSNHSKQASKRHSIHA